jgi:large subunit ribosomal protein L27
MASKKAGGTAKNLRDSQAKYLGVKRNHGQKVGIGEVLVRQRGTVYIPGANVDVGRDHTLFSTKAGTVNFSLKRKRNFNASTTKRTQVSVL